MDDISKFDILCLGLIAIPILVYSSSAIQAKLENMISRKHFDWPTPVLAIGLIYNYSLDSNALGLIGLTLGFVLFFVFYAAGITQIVKANKSETKNES